MLDGIPVAEAGSEVFASGEVGRGNVDGDGAGGARLQQLEVEGADAAADLEEGRSSQAVTLEEIDDLAAAPVESFLVIVADVLAGLLFVEHVVQTVDVAAVHRVRLPIPTAARCAQRFAGIILGFPISADMDDSSYLSAECQKPQKRNHFTDNSNLKRGILFGGTPR